MDLPPDTGMPASTTLLRSGTAARLAGLSPSTLRVWERRYGVVSPPKSPAGQRTYSMADIQRLRLIRQLTLEGHAIGTVAGLQHDALVGLSSGRATAAEGALRVVVVGQALAHKLEGRLRPSAALVLDDLDHAERDVAGSGGADVLVVHVAALRGAMTERVLAFRDNVPASNVLVVYAFGTEAAAEALRAAGVTVRREPVSGRELARLILASRPVSHVGIEADTEAGVMVARRRARLYSDEELVALAETPSTVSCECPRHLAEIVTLLVGFERYSAECVSQSTSDADLHRHLHEVTGAARSMLEQALAKVALDEGLDVRKVRP